MAPQPHPAQVVIFAAFDHTGDPPAVVRMRQRVRTDKGVEYIVEEERERTPSVGSSITFFKNGVSQGTALCAPPQQQQQQPRNETLPTRRWRQAAKFRLSRPAESLGGGSAAYPQRA